MLRSGRYLIVNADDFNLTASVNRGILKVNKNGIVTSTTVLVNFPLKKSWIKLLKSRKNLGIGLHLNIVVGPPVSDRNQVSSLLNKNGQFRWRLSGLRRPYPLDEIREEFESQLKQFKRLFLRFPTHLDTHHHAHYKKEIFTIVRDMSRRYRLPFRLSPALSKRDRESLKKRGVNLPDHFFGDIDCWTHRRLEKVIDKLPQGVSEIMVHPGYSSRGLSGKSSLNKERVRELNILCSSELRSIILKRQIRLINYGDLLK